MAQHFVLLLLASFCCLLLTFINPTIMAYSFPNWPTATGTQTVDATIVYSGGSYDMKNKRFTAGSALGTGDQSEDQKPIFKLSNGAKLSNVIIGQAGADGIHCYGSCTLENVWWEDVGEDAATFRTASGSGCETATFLITGGGAKSASDKVFQFNGAGTLTVKNFQVTNYGKLVCSCGECKTQCQRTIVIDTIKSSGQTGTLVGVNENFGDKATVSNVQGLGNGVPVCTEFTGVTSGSSTKLRDYKVGTTGDGKNCVIASSMNGRKK